MKLKRIIPWLILGAATVAMSGGQAKTETRNPQFEQKDSTHYTLTQTQDMRQKFLDQKADDLCATYMKNMLDAQKRLAPLLGKHGYRKAVRNELPGAPVGLHCVYGQYTQLNRALNEMGDTLTIIPDGAKNACWQFKHQMREKYSAPEYAGCIAEGRMFETDSAYNQALAKYMTQKGASVEKFAKRNFSAQKLTPGTILVVPRTHGSVNEFHAILLLGRGRLENGEFVPDSTGRIMYAGHNRETIGDLFKTWDTRNVFATDTKRIATIGYDKELTEIENMTTQQLVEYLNQDTPANTVLPFMFLTKDTLVQMARSKYFQKYIQNDWHSPINVALFCGLYNQRQA